MLGLLIALHIAVCIVLIATILLQAGRGGGLTEAAGGGSVQSVLGTQAPTVLKKATEVSAIIFLITCLLLGMITSRKGRSLFERGQFPVVPVMPQQASAPLALPAGPSQGSGKQNAVPVQKEVKEPAAPAGSAGPASVPEDVAPLSAEDQQ